MAKVKIKCASCGKSFKSPDAKRTLCPDCQAVRKAASAQSRGAQPVTPATTAVPAFDVRAAFRSAQQPEGNFAAYRPGAPPPEAPVSHAPSTAVRSSAPLAPDKPVVTPLRPPIVPNLRTSRPAGASAPRAARLPRPAPPRVVKERKPPTPPFAPSPEQEEAVRNRYLELAQPEFDGIRHQIAAELAIPINTVKAIVKDLRAQMKLPSWWELSALTLTDEQRAAVRALYLPELPLPEVGVHRHIAEQLGLRSLAVYTEIGALRDELGLPRFNERPDWSQPSPAGEPPASAEGDVTAMHDEDIEGNPVDAPAFISVVSHDDTASPVISDVAEQTGSPV